MTDTTCHMSISLDGFVAGPDQSRENPLGRRGREVHAWHLGDERANDAATPRAGCCVRAAPTSWAATCSDRSAVSGTRTGAAGGVPSRRTTRRCSCSPTTLTSRSRCKAGRVFTSSPTGSTRRTLRRVDAAGEDGVDIAGGASTVRQALAAGVIDELTIDIAPVLLGAGERIFEGRGSVRVRAGRGAPLAAGHPHPLPPGQLNIRSGYVPVPSGSEREGCHC